MRDLRRFGMLLLLCGCGAQPEIDTDSLESSTTPTTPTATTTPPPPPSATTPTETTPPLPPTPLPLPPPPPPASAMPPLSVVAKSVKLGSGATKASREYRWYDELGKLRTVAFPNGSSGGEGREFSYHHSDGTHRVLHGASWDGFEGFGWVMVHQGTPSQGSNNKPGPSTELFPAANATAHHAIREFTTTLDIGGAPTSVRVHWFFATGRSNPIYAITFTGGPSGTAADSRSPYGFLMYDQNGDVANSALSGVVWGDKYRFETTASASPLTAATGWSYQAANLIPFAYTYVSTTDAELGLVDTLRYSLTPSGYGASSGNISACQGKTSATAPTCQRITGWQVPQDWRWPYQMNAYELPYTAGVGKTAWGTAQAIGKASTIGWDGNTIATAPMSYSVAVVLGEHSTSATEAEVANQEANDGTTLSASVGNVATAGPLGVGRSDQAYPKAGYDPVYSTWRVTTVSGNATITLNSSTKTLRHPIVRFAGAAATAAIQLDGKKLTAEVDYFASSFGGELWVTFNAVLTGSHSISVDNQ